MTPNQIRVPLNNVIVKTKNNKAGKPFYYFEVLEPQWKFLQTDNPRCEALLSSFASSGEPVHMNVLLQKDAFVVDDESFV